MVNHGLLMCFKGVIALTAVINGENGNGTVGLSTRVRVTGTDADLMAKREMYDHDMH